MSEKHLRWAADADISIDYTLSPPSIHFFNVKISLKRSLLALLCGLFGFLLLWMFSLLFWSTSSQDYGGLLFRVILFVICFTLSVGGLRDLLSTGAFAYSPFLQIYLKWRTRHYLTKVSFENPFGTVKYRTFAGNPLIDLEMDEEVRRALQSATLLKLKKEGLYRPKELTLTFKEQTRGTLSIIEY